MLDSSLYAGMTTDNSVWPAKTSAASAGKDAHVVTGWQPSAANPALHPAPKQGRSRPERYVSRNQRMVTRSLTGNASPGEGLMSQLIVVWPT